MARWLIIKELVQFLVDRKKFFLAPLVIILLLMVLFIILAEIPVLSPFIYSVF